MTIEKPSCINLIKHGRKEGVQVGPDKDAYPRQTDLKEKTGRPGVRIVQRGSIGYRRGISKGKGKTKKRKGERRK